MITWAPWRRTTLTEEDRAVLDEVDQALESHREGRRESFGWFCARLSEASPRPRESFSRWLEASFVAAAQRAGMSQTRRSRLTARAAVAASLVAVLAVGSVVAVPAVGEGTFKRVKPREVATAPPVSNGAFDTSGLLEWFLQLKWTDPLDLSRQVGIAVYVPEYLPEGCEKWGSWFYNQPPIPPSVYLQYSCVSIGTKWGGGIAYGVPEGCLTEITILRQPALYQSCTWVLDTRTNRQVWSPAKMIYLERGESMVTVSDVRSISKEELIKIAESLRPVSGR